MKFINECNEAGSMRWHEFGIRGRRFELMALPNAYVRVGSFPRAWELSVDAEGWRAFTPTRTIGAFWPWKDA